MLFGRMFMVLAYYLKIVFSSIIDIEPDLENQKTLICIRISQNQQMRVEEGAFLYLSAMMNSESKNNITMKIERATTLLNPYVQDKIITDNDISDYCLFTSLMEEEYKINNPEAGADELWAAFDHFKNIKNINAKAEYYFTLCELAINFLTKEPLYVYKRTSGFSLSNVDLLKMEDIRTYKGWFNWIKMFSDRIILIDACDNMIEYLKYCDIKMNNKKLSYKNKRDYFDKAKKKVDEFNEDLVSYEKNVKARMASESRFCKDFLFYQKVEIAQSWMRKLEKNKSEF